MKVDRSSSIFNELTLQGNKIDVTNKQHTSFPKGINKADEYSWFYQLCVSGHQDEEIRIKANATRQTNFTHTNGQVFYSSDKQTWHRFDANIATDHTRLAQRFTWVFPKTGKYYISNTILLSYTAIEDWITTFVAANDCTKQTIGQSLDGHALELISFKPPFKPQGRILITTGCHPAEPDAIAAQAILEYLAKLESLGLRNTYQIDVMPMQNPDGFVNGSCLTSNGINLYWNFRKNDKKDCPEAFYLWKNIVANPPLLYLDIHAYVHQIHRPPMPYLKPLWAYQGATTKSIVNTLDKKLIKYSKGYYKTGLLAMWPQALSEYITKEFNTLAYTKYHLNLNEGIAVSQKRAVDIFKLLTTTLLKDNISADQVLNQPHGNAESDRTDTSLAKTWYQVISRLKQLKVLVLAYTRYFRLRFFS